MSMMTAILIAFLRTHNEGGSVAVPYTDTATCNAAGADLESKIEAVDLPPPEHSSLITPLPSHPTVIWTCIAG